MSKELVKKLVEIQSKLKAPKGQMNKFGGYAYRSCEDILEAVKPLLAEQGVILTLSDRVIHSGHAEKGGVESDNRFEESKEYIEATATISDGENQISVSAVARESYEKKGMDSAQVSGSTSSYARKYALNGLFLIDDTKDADATNDHGKKEPAKSSARKPKKEEPKKEAPKSEKKAEKVTDKNPEEVAQEAKEKSGGSFRRRRRG